MTRRPHRNVYRLADEMRRDPRLWAVWNDSALVGIWMRMRLEAPRRPYLPQDVPPNISPEQLQALADAGIVEALSGGQFRLLRRTAA
jgi:hypothetical protein